MAASQQMMKGLNQLLQGKLSPSLVSPILFNRTLQTAYVDAADRNLYVINNDTANAWRNPLDVFWNKDTLTFKVDLLVPAQRRQDACGMLKLQETPITISEDIHVVLDVDYSNIIEVCSEPSQKWRPRLQVMTALDYEDCDKEGQQLR